MPTHPAKTPGIATNDLPALVTTIVETRTAIADARRNHRRIALVPTLGALHAGHVSLIEAATRSGAYTVVSIYVNPTQFGRNEDFERYPRTLDADRRTCAQAGVDLIFVPPDAEVYPPGDEVRVHPGPLADALCGPFRPGHFGGVCTVVAKLFNIVQPDVAYFGQKDAQQLVIIRRMVADLHMPICVEACPLVRDADGLAMSSRNAGLSPPGRRRALSLYRGLCAGRDRLRAGENSIGRVVAAMRAVIAQDSYVVVDYLSVVDPDTLEAVGRPTGRVLIAGAIRVEGTRLIDNLLVDLPPEKP